MSVMARRNRASFKLSKQTPLTISQRTRRILIWLGALLGLLLLLILGAYMVFMSWLQGDSFRHWLERTIGRASGAAAVAIPENLVVDGQHMTLPQCDISGTPYFSTLKLRKLHVEVDRAALLQRWLKFRHLSAEELHLTLGGAAPAAQPARPAAKAPRPAARTARATTAPAAQQQPAAAAATLPADAPSTGFLKGIQAPTFESHYTVTKLVTGQNPEQSFSLSGYHMIATPKRAAGGTDWELNLENGRILTPYTWLRESGLKSAKILYRKDAVQLANARVLLTPGELRARGNYDPATGNWQATVDIDRADVARLLNDDWKKRLTGRLQGDLQCSGTYPGSWKAKGNIRLEKGILEGLPILSDLRIGDSRPYRSLSLEKATCTLTYPYTDPQLGIANAWLWDAIDVRAADGALLLRGRVITGSDGALSGALDVGLPSKMLAELGLSKTPHLRELFNAPVNIPGYVWVHVNLSGTVTAPQEDLSARLAIILPQALPGMADHAVQSLGSAISSFLPDMGKPAAAPATTGEDAPAETPQSPRQPTPPPAKQLQDALQSGLDMLF